MLSPKKLSSHDGIKLALALLLIAGALITWFNRQAIQDWVTVQSYTPSQAVVELTDSLALSDRGKFLLYVGKPSLSSRSEFNQSCERREATSAILGCYANGKIYIYDINNTELTGMREVTAIHEMLHVAWDRLSVSEQQRVGELLDVAYETVKTSAFEDRLAYYERTEPGQRHNELHSILATETATLPSELEAYYQRYFTDRSAIVALFTSYDSVFNELSQKTSALEAELKQMSVEINQQTASYNQAIQSLNTDITAHNARAAQVDRTNSQEVASYNATRNLLSERATQLEQQRTQIEAQTASYNQKIQEYNSLALRSQQLTNSLDSLSNQPSI